MSRSQFPISPIATMPAAAGVTATLIIIKKTTGIIIPA